MKRLVYPLAATIVLLTIAGTASAQTADELIEKCLTALGGRAALAKVKSRRTTGTITFQTPAGDAEGTIEVVNAAPNKTRTLIKADLTALGAGPMTVDQRFDGTTGYVLDSLQGNRDITGNQLDNMRNGSFPSGFLTYKSQGIAAKLEGKDKIGDRDAYLLILEPTSGSTVRQYIDATTYLPLRAVIKVQLPQLGDLEQMSDMSDYRDVDGVKVPFTLKVSSTVQSYSIAVSKVEHNITVDEKQFAKP